MNTQRLIIIIGVLVILAFFGYSFFMKGDGVSSEISQSNTTTDEDILTLVETLKKISIDKSLFTSELFIGLQDFSVSLYPEQQGRPNPFALVGVDNNNLNQITPPKKTGQ